MKHTVQIWRRGVLFSLFAGILVTTGLLGAAEKTGAATDKFVVCSFDSPNAITYSFLSWKDKIDISGGKAVFRNLKCDGGAGGTFKLDLSQYANFSPALRIRVNEGNTCEMFKVNLTDSNKKTSGFLFTIPKASSEFQTVVAKDSVALDDPNIREDKENPQEPTKLDLTKVTGYCLFGNWNKKQQINVEIEEIVLLPPNEKMLAERVARAKKIEEEKKKKALALANKIKRFSRINANSPKVVHVNLVAPDVLSLVVEAQRVEHPPHKKYIPEPGDELKEENKRGRTVQRALLKRNGKTIGYVSGPKHDWLFPMRENLIGHPLLEFLVENPELYTVKSKDDPAFAEGVTPIAVYRKTVPTNTALPGSGFATRHRIYLKLPQKIQQGKTYSISVEKLNIQNKELTFDADLAKVRSEAVHVNQLGYRPDDPSKRAFLSVWLGKGGACKYPEGMTFSVLDDATGQKVFSGKVKMVLDVDGKEKLWVKPPKNYNKTAVYKMDFDGLRTPGKYRIFVEGIGCSYPFEIKKGVWEKAFLVQMKGLYNERAGVELGPPYTDFKKPRDFHPDDGTWITRSTYDPYARKNIHGYKEIAENDTGEVVKNAWGGYHDAGDWNPRRVSHMFVTLAQLELVEMFPKYFNSLDLNIPSTEGIPDIITEALFEIDCFRRMQLPDGGIPWGIETDGDPIPLEVSWLSTQKCYVLPPNICSSWFYAAVAARAANVLKPIKPELAKVYEESAVKAFDWAEAKYAKDKSKADWKAIDARNLSSIILYDITGNKKYHDVFLQDTKLHDPTADIYCWDNNIQAHAVFHYARLSDDKADPKLKTNAIKAIELLGDKSLDYGAGNAFNVTNRERGRPMFAGFFTGPGGTEQVRAHFLTGKEKYLRGALQSCQFHAGCNPNNIVYTTGLGSNPIKNPLNVDARMSGQPAPIGLTSWGNVDIWNFKGFWQLNLRYFNKPEYLYPEAFDWPLTEAFFDIWVFVPANEFVVESWAPNLTVWGYLAARGAQGQLTRTAKAE